MHLLHRLQRHRRGFALLTVMMFIAIMAVLTASMLKYSASERRMNERNRLVLRARNMAENAALYASEQLTTKLYRLRSSSPMAFMTGSNRIYLPPDDVLTTPYSGPGDVEVRAGLTSSTGLQYIDPAATANATNPNAGLSVDTSLVPIIAKATMHHPALGSVTAYAEQDLQIAMIPLFQFAVFYNMDMEFGPGPDMIISGPVHTNGDLIARIQTGFNNTLQFKERVTAAGGFYADTAHKGKTYMGDGSADAGPGGTGPLYFQKASGTVTNIKSPAGVWRDYKFGATTETDTTRNQFKTFATSTYAGNFRTGVHGVTALNLPSIGGYKETDDPSTPEDDTKNGRQLIEIPSPSDTADLVQAKYSRRSGLYIVVNPDDEQRNGTLPDGSSVVMRARSYRAWLNTVNVDGTYSLNEIILPGQPSWGSGNANVNKFPNAYRTDTSVGSNQVLRIPNGDSADTGYADPTVPSFPTAADSYFYDLRRGTGSNSYPFNRPSQNWTPRPIAKIDFDMTRFKMSVDRTILNATTSTVFNPAPPDDDNWANSIWNPDADPAAYGLGIGDGYSTASATNLTINGYVVPGASANVQSYACKFAIDLPDGSGGYTLSTPTTSDASSITYSIPAGVTKIQIRQFLAGAAASQSDDGSNAGTSTLVDMQEIPIMSVDGSTTVTATLSNQYHVVASAAGSGGAVASQHTQYAATDMRIYVGGIDDTANWTFDVDTTSSSGTWTGSWGVGANFNRYRISNLTSDNATIFLRASKGSGASLQTVTKKFKLVLQGSRNQIKTPAQKSFWFTLSGGSDTIRTGVTADPFRIYFAPTDPTDVRIITNPSVFAVGAGDLVNINGACPWFDGVTVYVDSVGAEDHTTVSYAVPNRVDSGVRLWNGRGAAPSLTAASYPGRTGFSFATNDAVYIVGHFNADGTINSNANSTTNPGGYSGRYAESANEMLCSVLGDAITVLSQPVFTRASNGSSAVFPYKYYQTSGWADSLSSLRRSSSGWSSSWQTTNPSGSNSVDGANTSITPAMMPYLTRITGTNAGSGSSVNVKFDPSVTEVSTCLLTGIVRTTSAQTSGGVHNFVRLQEQWDGTGLYIRGSMVAMFESQVATEPWTIRSYTGAGRYWGLHQNLRAENGAHDLPLEPIVLNAQRLRYNELKPADYASKKATIEALPH